MLWAGAALFGLVASAPALAATPGAGTNILNQAWVDFQMIDEIASQRIYSNQVAASVSAVESLSLWGNTQFHAQPGAAVTIPYLLTNTGNSDSHVNLTLVNNGPGCAADTTDLSNLRVVIDANGNGVADSNEPAISALDIPKGQSLSLLVTGVAPVVSSGSACVSLSALTVTGASASVATTSIIDNSAALALLDTAAYSGYLVPGVSVINYQVSATNNGAQNATPAATDGSAAPTTIVINGVATPALLLRNPIPVGTNYVAGSLQSTNPNVVKLYRLPGDPPFSYRTVDDATAIEVAVAELAPNQIVPSGGLLMSFSAKLLASAGSLGTINSQSWANYADGHADTGVGGNVVALPVATQSVGVALAAGAPVAQSTSVSLVHMTAVVTNYGATTLYDVQLHHPVESSTGVGLYTAASLPATGQYTVKPGSVHVTASTDSDSKPTVNAAFDGRATGNPTGGDNLLGAPIVLRPAASATIEYDLLVNFTGWSATKTTQANAAAARVPGAALDVTDLSQNGANPDPTGNGPLASNTPTPISAMPILALQKTVQNIKRLGAGQYELTFQLDVTNAGSVPATQLRVSDNLDCAMTSAGMTNWTLVSAPVVTQGLLTAASPFTGKAPCNTPVDVGTGMPLATSLALTDGRRDLAPGQTEHIRYTVRVTVSHSPTTLTTGANAATLDATTGTVTAAATTSTLAFLSDPQGVVYDSATRQPIVGALVTLRRTAACSVGSSGPITPAEVFNNSLPDYTFNADGSLSMQTDANGQYQFYWVSPPLASVCTYTLSVAPPTGYSASTRIPAQSGSYQGCSAIVPLFGAPAAGSPTTWYSNIDSGFDPGSSKSCEVLNNNVPLDPAAAANALLLQKLGSKTAVELGDFMDYRLTLSNHSGQALAGVRFEDKLPPGLAFVPNSARLNASAVADPSGGAGPALSFSFPAQTLADGASAVLQYRVRVGVGAPTQGDVVNQAVGYAANLVSNQASFRTRVSGGVMSDDAFVFGKVILDCRAGEADKATDARSEPAPVGIPGVRLYLETGAAVTTDADGRWSLYGLTPTTHVVRLDAATLPAGGKLVPWDNRNAGAGDSRFIDPKKGELVKANFLLTQCTDALRDDVQARRKAAQGKADNAEIDAATNSRLVLTPTAPSTATSGDARALPAAGSVAGASSLAPGGSTGSAGTMGSMPSAASGLALIELPRAVSESQPAGAAITPLTTLASTPSLPSATRPNGARVVGLDLLGPLVSAGTIPLEKLLGELDAKPGFMDFKDGDTVATSMVNVRVKGPVGASLRLSVNGVAIGDNRVGEKASMQTRGVSAWEYIGVELKPGANDLTLDVTDELGVHRDRQSISIKAPGGLVSLQLQPPRESRADPLQPITIALRLSDAQGIPVTARTQITLQADQGAWLETDLNPSEVGVQINVTGGKAELKFQPPAEPGPVRLRVSANQLVEETLVRFLPQDRPLAGIGLIDGVIDLSKRGTLSLGQTNAGAAFEQELTMDKRAGMRAAFYFKGTILGEYLLTTAFDSSKSERDRLFRDIKPDQYYPVYGDTSARSFDAQSSGKLYVRIDHNRSYLLLGDFSTASSEEVRKISQISRNLNGVKGKFENDSARVTAFASRDHTVQQVQEIPATGVSFLYLSGQGDIVVDSERVELVTRSRTQPQLIVGVRALTRGTDYTFEPLQRRLLMAQPVSMVDADLNPQSIRVSFEVDNGGEQFTVAGVDAQVKIGDALQLGAVVARDENPQNKRNLNAVTALARVGEHAVVAAEAVSTHSDLNGAGRAVRVEGRYADGAVKAQAQVQRADLNFDNPSAGVTAGTEQDTASVDYTLNADTRIRAEASRNVTQSAQPGVAEVEQRSLSLALQRKFSPNLVGQIGLKRGSSTGATPFDYGSLGTGTGGGIGAGSPSTTLTGSATSTLLSAGLGAKVPGVQGLEAFGEIDQDVHDVDQRAARLGLSYALTDKTRLYAREEIVSEATLAALPNANLQTHTTVLGIDSAYMEGGRVYNEARLGGAGVQNASGVRNTVKLNDAWSLTGGLERSRGVVTGSGSAGDSDAIALGVTYSAYAVRGNAAYERHTASDGTNSGLYSLAAASKVDADWTVLARGIRTVSESPSAGSHAMAREQFGLAWRPAARDDLNALLRVELRQENLRAGTSGATDSLFNSDGSALPGAYRTEIVSALVNYNPRRGLTLSGRYAAKRTRYSDDQSSGSYWAQLLHSRLTMDLSRDWDLGVQAGMMFGQGGARQGTAGLEVGYQIDRNIWLSTGFNFIGLRDRDLSANDYTDRGVYLRLRLKFDENGIGGASDSATRKPASSNSTSSSSLGKSGSEVMPTPLASASALAQPAASKADAEWAPGQPLGGRVVINAPRLFDAGSAALSVAGRELVAALAGELAKQPNLPELLVSVGHGAPLSELGADEGPWLRRAAALRKALAALIHVPGGIHISVDGQPIQALAADTSSGTLVIAVVQGYGPQIARGVTAGAQSAGSGVAKTSSSRRGDSL